MGMVDADIPLCCTQLGKLKPIIMYAFEADKFGIVIIESLDKGEIQTGTELKEGLLKYKKFQNNEIEVQLENISTKNEMIRTLKDLVDKVKNEKFFPILQFEVHGYDDGICTTNGDCLSWKEIMPYLEEINILLRNFLIILLGVCKGASIIKYAGIHSRAPFKAIIGSAKVLTSKQIREGFHAFYDKFFFSMDTYESIAELRKAIGSDDIGILRIEDLYDQQSNPDKKTAHYSSMIKKMVKHLKSSYTGVNHYDEQALVELANEKLEEMHEELRSKRSYYLMEDLIDPKMREKEDQLYGED